MGVKSRFDVEALEELFLDELEFKVRSMILLLAFGKIAVMQMNASLRRLEDLSRKNLEIIHSYDKQAGSS